MFFHAEQVRYFSTEALTAAMRDSSHVATRFCGAARAQFVNFGPKWLPENGYCGALGSKAARWRLSGKRRFLLGCGPSCDGVLAG
jgi:hypothetical protein